MRTFVLHSDTQARALAAYLRSNRAACAAAKTFPATLTDDQKARVAAAYTERKNCLERNEYVYAEEADRFDAELN